MTPGDRARLVFEGYDPASEGQREALCSLGNGYLATRGVAPEATDDGVHYPGTYVAGVYNRLVDAVDGHQLDHESLVNLPNWVLFEFRTEDGAWFSMDRTEVLDHTLTLDMRQAQLIRELRFRDAAGRVTSVTQRRLVHRNEPHLAAIETTFRPEGWSGTVEVRSILDGAVENNGVERYRDLGRRHLRVARTWAPAEDIVALLAETTDSRIRIAEAARTRVLGALGRIERSLDEGDGHIGHRLVVPVADGQEIVVEKVVTIYTSRDTGIYEPGDHAIRHVAWATGYDDLAVSNTRAWAHVWRRTDIEIEGSVSLARGLMLQLYQLHQVISKHTTTLDVGIPARGLVGEAYRGHIFWDELFVFPYVNLRVPEHARALLMYRFRRLDEARRRAREAGFEGALFPWQSASSGREETPQAHLNPRSGHWLPDHSRLQRHVNSAIAHNVVRYLDATDDQDFLSFSGAELMVEIARFWASAATYDHIEDRYEIHGVVGPDEYHEALPDADHPGVDNNAYTNVMAAWVLWKSGEILDRLDDDRREEIVAKLAITAKERERWDEISRRMRVCFHDGVISQFEGYERLHELDWDAYRARYGNIQRLDRILEAEGDTANRYRLSKQADVLMLLYLFSPREVGELFDRLGYVVDEACLDRTIDYYLKRTSNGSTLSQVVHAWVVARRDLAQSFDALCDALRSDLDDSQGGTTAEGVHIGAMAGTVDLIERCYTGLTIHDDAVWFDPAVPPELGPYSFNLRFRGNWLDVRVSAAGIELEAHGHNRPVPVGFDGEVSDLAPGERRVLARTFDPGIGTDGMV
ncbi:MAG: glycosyl hydrolase family 65 protein [Acidimicrobiales bacterium]